jgi:hypothetical protein
MARPFQFRLSTLLWAIAAVAGVVAFAKLAPGPAFVALAIATLPVCRYLEARFAEHRQWESEQGLERSGSVCCCLQDR